MKKGGLKEMGGFQIYLNFASEASQTEISKPYRQLVQFPVSPIIAVAHFGYVICFKSF